MWRTARRIGIYETKINTTYKTKVDIRTKKSNQMFCVKVAQMCSTLCDPKDYTVHGILLARILEWIAISFSSVLLDIIAGNVCQDNVYKQCLGGCYFYKKSVFSEEILQENCTIIS